jgi:hypothetical protein
MPRSIKFYDTYPSRPFVTEDIRVLLGSRRIDPQCMAYVAAHSKAEALEYFKAAGVGVSTLSHLRMGMGNGLAAVRAEGLLDKIGDVIVTASANPRHIVLCPRGPGEDPRAVGTWTYDWVQRKQVIGPLDESE